MKGYRSSHIGQQFGLMSVLSLISMLLLFYLFYSAFSDTFYEEKKQESRDLTTSAVSMIEGFYKLSQSSEMTELEAQQLALHALKSSRSFHDGYYWVNDSYANMVMHPERPDLMGINLAQVEDINGLHLFSEFVREAHKGGGWVDYYWTKPGVEREVFHKVSYVALFEPWDWVIGTGVYLDEVEAKNNRLFIQSIELIVVAFLLMAIVSVMWAKRSTILIRDLAIKDPLTGLYSRRYLNESGGSFISQDRRNENNHLYVLFLDIDHFKQINDSFGHRFGDEVLHEVGNVLLEHTRPEDLCVRYGGEEFVILTLAHQFGSVHRLAERLRAHINALELTENIDLTVSVGIAMRGCEESMISVLNRADQYLYEAKESGRDCVVSESV
ncbi:diguanylate cyclase [Neptuniibacter sp. QD48_11]|uniref:diguanylate cyclase n=1 Tax=Neptuniibacter sp. QD48_11 TaxID=3398211 RepID=UPI0039F5A59F